MLHETASQTAGPYVHLGCQPVFSGVTGVYAQDLGLSAIDEGVRGQIITIRGTVFDGAGAAMPDAMVESWQPDAKGLFAGQVGADPKVSGFCRFAVDAETGDYTLRTVKPGSVSTREGAIQSPHISLWIVARGINIGLQTRMYFGDEDNVNDPLLARVEPRTRVETLLAQKTGESEYRFDIRLSGEGETVFLDI